MRLISSFQDYYDGLRGIDRDPEPLYVRERRVVRLAELSTVERRAMGTTLGALWSDWVAPPPCDVFPGALRVVIGFCGVAYPGYVVAGRPCADVEGVIAAVRATADADVARHALAHLEETRASAWARGLSRGTWARFVAGHRPAVGDAPFIALGAPIVVVTDDEVIVNARLGDYGFGSRRDPYAAWQELSVYLGNNLAQAAQRAPRPITDELKAHAHGFDRQSFRNTKGRPKGNRSDW